MRVLFVEDELAAIQPVLDILPEGSKHEVCDFHQAEDKLEDFKPDVVVLDLVLEGSSAERDPAGIEVEKEIWNRRFCPIVIYSAHPEYISDSRDEHPFITFVKKGRGSPDKVIEAFSDFEPHVQSANEVANQVQAELSRTLRDVAPKIFDLYSDAPESRKSALLRSARRRLAASMDDMSHVDGEQLQSWEQFIFPPISDDLYVGDIIRRSDEDSAEPKDFRIVLSPSCDLASSGGRVPKVEDVLVARCFPFADALKSLGFDGMKKGKLETRLKSGLLSTGFAGEILPIPQLRGVIPTMVANLKKLELISLKKISEESGDFFRVASVDSPFRELVSWAYLQTSARPGLPDRDKAVWSKEILEEL